MPVWSKGLQIMVDKQKQPLAPPTHTLSSEAKKPEWHKTLAQSKNLKALGHDPFENMDQGEKAEANPSLPDENKVKPPKKSGFDKASKPLDIPPETSSHILDDLITSIDQEIEHIFGSNKTMVDLTAKSLAERKKNKVQFIVFTLAGVEYAASAANVREVGEIINLTPVPNVPSWLLGVTNLRGDILSVVDLRTFLGMEQSGHVESVIWSRSALGVVGEMLVAYSNRGDLPIATGLIVDEVNDIRHLNIGRISKSTAPLEDQIAAYLQGIYEEEGRTLIVLDFEKLLHSAEMKQFEPV